MRHRKSDHIKRLMTLTTKLRALILSLNEKNSLIHFLILFFQSNRDEGETSRQEFQQLE